MMPMAPMPGEASMGHEMTGGQHIVASHIVVGTVLHLAMSVTAGVAFAVVLAVLIRAGVSVLTLEPAVL
jgi:hypothetical protein